MKSTRKIIAVVLSVLMALSVMVMPSFAAKQPTEGITKTAFSNFYPNTDTYNVVSGGWAQQGNGTVVLDEKITSATDYAFCYYYGSHYTGYPYGYTWVSVENSNPDAVKVSYASTSEGLAVTFEKGSAATGSATVTIDYTVTKLHVTAGIASDSDTTYAVSGRIVYTVNSVCNHVNTEYQDNGDGATHKIVCAYCGKVITAKEAHELGAWVTTVAASCTTNGTQTNSCVKCGAEVTRTILAFGHKDADKDGICDTCKVEIGHPDEDGDGKCDICDEEVAHVDKDGDGVCDNCGEEIGHPDADGDGKCDYCGKEVAHVDKDGDGKCDNCGEEVGHEDKDGDGKCDYCDKDMNEVDPSNPNPNDPSNPDDPSATCGHWCHRENWVYRIAFAVVRIFWKMFRIHQYCECGVAHW